MIAKLVRHRDPQVFEREFNALLKAWLVASIIGYSTEPLKTGSASHIEYSVLVLLHGDEQPAEVIKWEVA
jgi:hypothetical protein